MEPQLTSSRRRLAPLVTFGKRAVRKLIRWYVAPQLAELRQRQADLAGLVESLHDEVARLNVYREVLEDEVARLHQYRADAEDLRVAQQVSEQERYARLARHIHARPAVNPEFGRAEHDPAREEFDYHGFVQKFRGPSALIKQKLSAYVNYYAGCARVIDLGCGCGEFLEALRDAGLSGVGVERGPRQAEACRRKGIEVIEADLFDVLDGLDDGSVEGIFAAGVVEHLAAEQLNRLFRLCRRKLRPGGLFIAETVNPHCLAALKLFHLDPTRVAPLYPEVAQFVAESAGFTRVEILVPDGRVEPHSSIHECEEYAILAGTEPS
jgi:O-antigen chain-terminating methyltransferase